MVCEINALVLRHRSFFPSKIVLAFRNLCATLSAGTNAPSLENAYKTFLHLRLDEVRPDDWALGRCCRPQSVKHLPRKDSENVRRGSFFLLRLPQFYDYDTEDGRDPLSSSVVLPLGWLECRTTEAKKGAWRPLCAGNALEVRTQVLSAVMLR
jgi:hypothetical protein